MDRCIRVLKKEPETELVSGSFFNAGAEEKTGQVKSKINNVLNQQIFLTSINEQM